MSRFQKLKKFKLDKELETLADWSAYGAVWRKFKGGTKGVKQPDCTADKPCLRTGWYRFPSPDQDVAYEYVSYTVSNGHRVIAQGFDNPFHARLIAAAPELLRFVKDIADGKALALSVVADAQHLMEQMRQGVHVPGKTDFTEGPYDPDAFDTDWSA